MLSTGKYGNLIKLNKKSSRNNFKYIIEYSFIGTCYYRSFEIIYDTTLKTFKKQSAVIK